MRHIGGDETFMISRDGYALILEMMVNCISQLVKQSLKHVLWLADKKTIIEEYEGTEENIESFRTPPVVLYDLGADG